MSLGAVALAALRLLTLRCQTPLIRDVLATVATFTSNARSFFSSIIQNPLQSYSYVF